MYDFKKSKVQKPSSFYRVLSFMADCRLFQAQLNLKAPIYVRLHLYIQSVIFHWSIIYKLNGMVVADLNESHFTLIIFAIGTSGLSNAWKAA